MSTCKEHDLSKIARIEAIKLEDIIHPVPVYLQNLYSGAINVQENMLDESYINKDFKEYGLPSGHTLYLKKGKTYTMTMTGYVKPGAKSKGLKLRMYVYTKDSSGWTFLPYVDISDVEEKTVSYTFTYNKEDSVAYYGFWYSSNTAYSQYENLTDNDALHVTCAKLEEGSEATPWCYSKNDLATGCSQVIQKNSAGNSLISLDYSKLTKIPFTKDSAKLDDKQDISVAGRVNTITLSWKWQPNTQADYDWLLDLQNNPHELLITYFGGTQRIVRTSPDAYKFTFEDNDGDCKCKMTLVNGQGFTRILDE